MTESEVVVSVVGIYKNFKLPHQRKNSLKSLFTSVFDNKKASKSYEVQHALEDISFDIKKGEFFGIVGRNGSGKSTLLKMLAGIYQPTKGSLNVNGKLVPFIELGVGFNPELTGRENVFLNGALLGFSQQEVSGFYSEVVEFAELERFMDQKLKNYSSGMQVRLAFSMAVRANADILLIDEVLAVGDADFQRKCYEYFKKLKKNKKTVVFVSHDMDAVRQYCDKAVLLENGKIIVTGKADKVAQAYTKLFTTNSEFMQKDEEITNRWGEGNVIVDDIKVKVLDDMIMISETLTARQSVDGFIPGFMIKSSNGEPITGTNSRLEHKTIGKLKKGKSVEIEWTMPNILSSGGYTIVASVHNDDASVVYDWFDDAKSFRVTKDRDLSYMVDPGINLEIKQKQ